MAKKCIFILGGARSGKSDFAQELAEKLGNNVLFVATGEALDEEMQARIDRHRKARPRSWRTLELPQHVGQQLEKRVGEFEVVIIDCLTLLISNCLGNRTDYPQAEKQAAAEIHGLIACMNKANAVFIIISNEVGLGLVPESKLGRIYRDALGKANQLIASSADEVYLLVAGIPTRIKGD